MTPPPKAAAAEPRESPAVVDDSHGIRRNNKRKPVVIYMVSPEVIHVKASEFMTLVQRLTGPSAAAGEECSSPSVSVNRQVVPVRVKARALIRRPPTPARDSPSSQLSTLFFHDLSPPSTYAARKDEPMAAPQSWLLGGGYLDQSPRREPGLGSGSAYLDALDRRPERSGGQR
ncbi:uncharacterized protein LOC121998417 [Zingiber officinale]|uniref:VQ domain-containing protein n=1 Tax=Zingiber officinale TaxID=94328 RepID=A0A8J5I7P6_ZINOF|nr:uncharacterized protein LOC121998417 [Zingiber officinale]KAG6535135.1 hypothetical protein ZIOFF_000092 [Zingiber officinale]